MDFLNGSFKIGRLFDINIRVHMLFVLWVAFNLMQSGGKWRDELMFTGMLFGIILVHEFGHCFGARSVRGDARDILMWPLGGLAYAHAPMRPWPQFVTVACGPLVNVVFCVGSALLLYAGSGGNFIPGVNPLHPTPLYVQEFMPPAWFSSVYLFYYVNLFLLAFNLLPIYPLDGGQLLHTILWPFLGLQQSTIVAASLGLAGAVFFALWALTGDGGHGMLFFIAIFGGFTCWQRLQAARAGYLLEDSPYETYGPSHDPRPWYQRIFRVGTGRRSRPGPRTPVEFPNPNPGGWAAKQAAQHEEDSELDRILKKVSETGLQSLTYVERQKLERITRERKERDHAFERERKL